MFYQMPSYSCLQALKDAKEFDPLMPFILFTGSVKRVGNPFSNVLIICNLQTPEKPAHLLVNLVKKYTKNLV